MSSNRTAPAPLFGMLPPFPAVVAAIVMLMSGYILFDTSRMIHGGIDNYIVATVGLFLNIFNLFLSLLQLLGFSSDNR